MVKQKPKSTPCAWWHVSTSHWFYVIRIFLVKAPWGLSQIKSQRRKISLTACHQAQGDKQLKTQYLTDGNTTSIIRGLCDGYQHYGCFYCLSPWRGEEGVYRMLITSGPMRGAITPMATGGKCFLKESDGRYLEFHRWTSRRVFTREIMSA